MAKATILVGDCRERLRELPDASIDSCVCDPPYHLTSIVKRFGSPTAAPAKVGQTGAYARASKGFMGQTWDGGDVAFDPDTWREVWRVLKPGAHMVAFSGTRTYHRMVCAIEDAGFEIRDQLAWVYGSGFPKSHDVAKAIDKISGHWRGRAGQTTRAGSSFGQEYERTDKGDPVTAAAAWEGWGTSLKPAWEPICLARKPLVSTVAGNVLQYGTGALNIDACRIGTEGGGTSYSNRDGDGKCLGHPDRTGTAFGLTYHASESTEAMGRWPANILHDGNDGVLAGFPQTGAAKSGGKSTGRNFGQEYEDLFSKDRDRTGHDDNGGSAARFFYTAKTSPDERGEDNNHPTVKPKSLMSWLVRLITPPNGIVLDPFCGSGSTLVAACAGEFNAIGCELSSDYADIAERRIKRECGFLVEIQRS